MIEPIRYDYEAMFERVGERCTASRGRSDAEQLADARKFFDVFTDRYTWHSEDSLQTADEDAHRYALACNNLLEYIEPEFTTEEPAYRYTRHPLLEFIRTAWAVWYWYEDAAAAKPLLEAAVLYAESLKTPGGIWIAPREEVARIYDIDSLSAVYRLAQPHHISHYYLGEIHYTRERWTEALASFQEFLRAEPKFACRERTGDDVWYFYRRRDLPDTIAACRYAGIIAHKHLGDRETAQRYFEYAIRTGSTYRTPHAEYAELLREEGRVLDAFIQEKAGLDAMLVDREREDKLVQAYMQLAERYARLVDAGDREYVLRACLDAAVYAADIEGRHTTVDFRTGRLEVQDNRDRADIDAAVESLRAML